ncbi:MAG: AMP-binding protein [Actinomycetota bacterium]|nr:AMP-binding protein [Actinomycetota bacterium]
MSGYDASAYRRFFEHEFSYIGGFSRNTHRYANRPALIDPADGSVTTYAELGRRVAGLAAGLAGRGVGKGDIVSYQLFNSVPFAELYLATQAFGAVGSPINYRLAPGETAFILDDCTPAAFIYDAALEEATAKALSLARHRPGLLVRVGKAEAELVEALDWEELGRPGAMAPAREGSIYDETTRLFTSGTTGMPKAVPLNSAVEIFSAHDVIMHFPLSPDDRTLNMTPWFHRGGLYSGGPNPVFYVGAAALPMRAFEPGLCLDYVEQHRITFLIGAPTTVAMLANAQQERPRDLSSLRGIVTMGSPLEREAALRYQALLSPRIFNGYGTTEAFWNTFLRPGDLPDGAGSAGQACIDDDVAVVRLFDDRPAEPDELAAKDGHEVGEVIVRSPKSGMAYAGAGTRENRKYRDGWLYIGDLATWDEDEFVTIVGRKDDMIISGGENVHPVQVEEVLNQHPGVADSLVVGISDPTWGRRVVAYVVPKDPTLNAAELDLYCKGHSMLAGYKRPRAYRFVESLPLTATGKKVHYVATRNAEEEHAQGLFQEP